MSKIVSRLVEDFPWLEKISAINYIVFILLFTIIIIGVFRMKKSDVEEYKNLPLDNKGTNDYNPSIKK